MAPEDTKFMKRALELATRGAGMVSPNPMVGAVIVSGGKVIGEGFHRFDLLRHAESYAIEQAGDRARGATLYCNLEPCCHHGRTPPCTDALMSAGVGRTVIALTDPDPRVSGRGLEQLRAAGIVVDVGVCEDEARQLNEQYLKYISTGKPFIHSIVSPEGARWAPSSQLLAQIGSYDALVLDGNTAVDEVFLRAFLAKACHRAPILLARSDRIMKIKSLVGELAISHSASAHGEGPWPASALGEDDGATQALSGSVAAAQETIQRVIIQTLGNPGALADDLIAAGATSAVVLGTDQESLGRLPDKVTVVSDRALERARRAGQIESTSVDLRDAVISAAGEFVEITGYPTAR